MHVHTGNPGPLLPSNGSGHGTRLHVNDLTNVAYVEAQEGEAMPTGVWSKSVIHGVADFLFAAALHGESCSHLSTHREHVICDTHAGKQQAVKDQHNT